MTRGILLVRTWKASCQFVWECVLLLVSCFSPGLCYWKDVFSICFCFFEEQKLGQYYRLCVCRLLPPCFILVYLIMLISVLSHSYSGWFSLVIEIKPLINGLWLSLTLLFHSRYHGVYWNCRTMLLCCQTIRFLSHVQIQGNKHKSVTISSKCTNGRLWSRSLIELSYPVVSTGRQIFPFPLYSHVQTGDLWLKISSTSLSFTFFLSLWSTWSLLKSS